jgi:hypothetical protein
MPSHIGLLVQDVAKAAIAGQIFPMCCNSAREEVLSLTWISGRWWSSYKPVLLGFFSWHAAPEYGRLKMNLRKQDRRKMKDGIRKGEATAVWEDANREVTVKREGQETCKGNVIESEKKVDEMCCCLYYSK